MASDTSSRVLRLPMAAALAILACPITAVATDYRFQYGYGDTRIWDSWGVVYYSAQADAVENGVSSMRTTDTLQMDAYWFVRDETGWSGGAHRFRMDVYDNGSLRATLKWAKDTGGSETGFWSKFQSTPRLTFSAGRHDVVVEVRVIIDLGWGNRMVRTDSYRFVVNVN